MTSTNVQDILNNFKKYYSLQVVLWNYMKEDNDDWMLSYPFVEGREHKEGGGRKGGVEGRCGQPESLVEDNHKKRRREEVEDKENQLPLHHHQHHQHHQHQQHQHCLTDEAALKKTKRSENGVEKSTVGGNSPYRQPKNSPLLAKQLIETLRTAEGKGRGGEDILSSSDERILPPSPLKGKIDAAWLKDREAGKVRGGSPVKSLKDRDKENDQAHVRFDETRLAMVAGSGIEVNPKLAPTPTKTPRSILKSNLLIKQKPKIFLKNENGHITSSPLVRQETKNGNSPHVPLQYFEDDQRSPLKSKINSPQSPPYSHKGGTSPVKLVFKSPCGKALKQNQGTGSPVKRQVGMSPAQSPPQSPPSSPHRSPKSPPRSPPSPHDNSVDHTDKNKGSPFKSPASVKVTKPFKSPHSSKNMNSSDRMRMPPPTTPPPRSSASFRSQSPEERFSLNSPLLRRKPTTPEYSPVSPDGRPSGEECAIRDYYFESEDKSSDSDEEQNLLRWCRKPNLHNILLSQQHIDPTTIFGSPTSICDLSSIFGVNRKHYQRTDRFSAVWQQLEEDLPLLLPAHPPPTNKYAEDSSEEIQI